MTVRLAPVPVLAPGAPVTPEPVARRMPLPAPDLHYYPARDLDDYPRPLAPLRFDRPAGGGAGEVRLEILVDERGVVQDVIFARPVEPGRAYEGLRVMLATTHFLPARKDGHAVRSRIVLSVGFDAVDSER